MPLTLPNPTPRPQATEWARLIPGDQPKIRPAAKKPPRAVGSLEVEAAAGFAEERSAQQEHGLTFLLPHPLQSCSPRKCLRAVITDLVVVGLDWLLAGALLVPLRAFFPRVWSFGYGAGSPASLLGIAVLNATLITLIGYCEGLYAATSEVRAEARAIANAVLWSTAILALAYGLEGGPWTRGGLCCAAGLLHFGALLGWRSQNRLQRRREVQSGTAGRNVLIVGAGPVGRRLASSIGRDGSEDRNVCGFLDDHIPLGDGVIGRVRDLAHLARTGFIDEIILAELRDQAVALEVLREAKRLRLDVKLVPDLFGCKLRDAELGKIGAFPVISLNTERLPMVGLLLKRLIDVFGAGSALVLLSPALVLIAAIIRLGSPGSAFYCARESGGKRDHSAATNFAPWLPMPIT